MSFFRKTPLDFLAIGDITVDAFIHLTEASVTCDEDMSTHKKTNCKLTINFPDKIPYDSLTEVAGVGNSPNAAVSVARLGLRAAVICAVGEDLGGPKYGHACIDSLKKNRVSTDYVTVQKNTHTNYHYALWYEADRTILIKQNEYAYAMPKIAVEPKWIYLSSMGASSYPFHLEILEYLKAHPRVRLAFQPGTFQMRLGLEKLRDVYLRTEVFICNLEESQLILGTKETNITVLLKAIAAYGPKIVLITDGPQGAYMYDGSTAYFMPIYPDLNAPYERTGCGDAFASTFVAALELGKTPLEALRWAPINSMSVVEYIGAQAGLLSRPSLENLLKKAPPTYQPRAL